MPISYRTRFCQFQHDFIACVQIAVNLPQKKNNMGELQIIERKNPLKIEFPKLAQHLITRTLTLGIDPCKSYNDNDYVPKINELI